MLRDLSIVAALWHVASRTRETEHAQRSRYTCVLSAAATVAAASGQRVRRAMPPYHHRLLSHAESTRLLVLPSARASSCRPLLSPQTAATAAAWPPHTRSPPLQERKSWSLLCTPACFSCSCGRLPALERDAPTPQSIYTATQQHTSTATRHKLLQDPQQRTPLLPHKDAHARSAGQQGAPVWGRITPLWEGPKLPRYPSKVTRYAPFSGTKGPFLTPLWPTGLAPPGGAPLPRLARWG